MRRVREGGSNSKGGGEWEEGKGERGGNSEGAGGGSVTVLTAVSTFIFGIQIFYVTLMCGGVGGV